MLSICAMLIIERIFISWNLEEGDKRMKKIIVTTDGSENSERALLEAKNYAELIQADLTVLAVANPLALWGYSGKNELSERENEILKSAGDYVLDEALKVIDDFEGEVTPILKVGSPADEILKETEDGVYELIVMGSRGAGIFSRRMLGSVSNKVLNHTETNVLIVK